MKLKEFCVLNEGGNVVIVLLEGEVEDNFTNNEDPHHDLYHSNTINVSFNNVSRQ